MNENVNEKIRPNEIVDYLNGTFVNEIKRELLFASHEISNRTVRGAQPLLRIILTGALFCYIYYQKNKAELKEEQESEYFLKAASLCDDLFKENELTLEAATYLLFLIRRDVVNNKNSFFAPCMDIKENCEFGKIYGLLDEWSSSRERILVYYKNYHIYAFLLMASNCLKILREAEIKVNNQQVSFVFNKQEYALDKYLTFNNQDELFILSLKDDKYFDFKNLTTI